MRKFSRIITFAVFLSFIFSAFYFLNSKVDADTTALTIIVTTVTPSPSCGDGSCNGSETCSSCSADCGSCPSGGGGREYYISPTPTAPPPPPPPRVSCDFNGDDLCNFRDLSILLYWFEKTGTEISRYDFNKDKKINFIDVSIFLYHWKDE